MKVLKENRSNNSTDIALMVNSTSRVEALEYDEELIIKALTKEIKCDIEVAKKVAISVTQKLISSNLKNITTSFIRSMVNMVLMEEGYNKQLKSNSDVAISYYDIEEMIENQNKENGNTSHSPESINLNIAEKVLKEYALNRVFEDEVSAAHLNGKIHIHDLGMIDRLYCSGHSVEYVKKNGLKNIPSITTDSKPAKTAYVLARHICSFTQFLSGQFAGAIGWEAINVFFAPLLENMEYTEIKQLAQTLIFDLAQLAGARGGQVSFTDFNVYASIPHHYEEVYAMGSDAKFMVKDYLDKKYYFDTRDEAKKFADENDYIVIKYKDYSKESKLFAKAILEVISKGDANGTPFAFPKINFHINEESFTNKETASLVKFACESASKIGCPYFIFDRNACSVSQCCRLKIDFSEDDMKLINTPEELRFVGGQNVSINLPNAALQVDGDVNKFYNEIYYRMDLACKAHLTRKEYIDKITNVPNSPIKFYREGMDGKPYVREKNISWLIGIVGLNECVYNLYKGQLHDSKEIFLKGLEIVSFMYDKIKELTKKYNLSLKLEETPAESTATRFAKLDIKHYGDKAYHKENEFGVYYTNSIHYATDSDVDYIQRLKEQSKFHSIVEAGSMIHIWGGENNPSPEAVYKLLEDTWYKTKCVQWVLSPEYTICKDCHTRSNGLNDNCPKCNSENVRGITRITGYFVFVDKFISGKRAELKDRKRECIK